MPPKRFQYKYDFEVGYLIKSPCLKCGQRDNFPKCSAECELLDKIQTILTESVSCTRRHQ